MSDRILFLSNGSICYDSTTYFIDCISEELKAMGWEVMHIRLDKATQKDKLCVLADEYDSQPFDYVFVLIQSWTQYVMIREDTALTGLEKRYGIIFLTIPSITTKLSVQSFMTIVSYALIFFTKSL